MGTSELSEHGGAETGLSLSLGQVQVLLESTLALEHMETGNCQLAGVERPPSLPGVGLDRLASQSLDQDGIVPALVRRRGGSREGVIDAVIADFFIPGTQFSRPAVALLSREV